MMGAMSKYKQYFNAACEQRYKLSRYRRELAVAEKLRADEEIARVKIASENLQNKEKNVKGFKDREEQKDALRQQQIQEHSSGDGLYPAVPSVFRDL